MSKRLLEVKNLSLGINVDNNIYKVTEDVSFTIDEGEICGLVGESGCGKSVTSMAIAGLFSKDVRILGGSIIYNGRDILNVSKNEKRKYQGKEISVIFQEPMTSLNPVMKIGKQVGENLKLHTNMSKSEIKNEVINILKRVGLKEPEKIYNKYSYELSGGMRQRVMIAMAVICKPKLIIADEPTTALDVTIQAEVLELLKEINREYNTAILFISHDLGVIRKICSKINVMYFGEIVEEGTSEEVFMNPSHPYTKGLLNSIPNRSKKGKLLKAIEGKVPSITEKRIGCSFAQRCEYAKKECFKMKPQNINIEYNHFARCNYAEEGSKYAEGM